MGHEKKKVDWHQLHDQKNDHSPRSRVLQSWMFRYLHLSDMDSAMGYGLHAFYVFIKSHYSGLANSQDFSNKILNQKGNSWQSHCMQCIMWLCYVSCDSAMYHVNLLCIMWLCYVKMKSHGVIELVEREAALLKSYYKLINNKGKLQFNNLDDKLLRSILG